LRGANDLVIREPNNSVTLRLQHRVAFGILAFHSRMRRPINLDHKLRGHAVEVHDESTDGVLPAKSHTQRATS
jgi:hypothetical protein